MVSEDMEEALLLASEGPTDDLEREAMEELAMEAMEELALVTPVPL